MSQIHEWVSFEPYETKKKGSPAQPLREKIAGELRKKAEPGYLGFSETWDSRDMQ